MCTQHHIKKALRYCDLRSQHYVNVLLSPGLKVMDTTGSVLHIWALYLGCCHYILTLYYWVLSLGLRTTLLYSFLLFLNYVSCHTQVFNITKLCYYCAQVSVGSQQKSASSKHQGSQSHQSTAAKGTENENITKTVNSSMGKSSKTT